MRVAAFFAIAAFAVVSGIAQAPARSMQRTSCGPRFTFLVWPHGHPALPAIRFPRITNPHVEAYLDFGDQWPDARAASRR